MNPASIKYRQLKAFAKVALRPGQGTTVDLPLTNRDLSAWNSACHRWVTFRGTYRLLAGSSSRDIRASGSVRIG